jgi:DnaD/phage-associated family protein
MQIDESRRLLFSDTLVPDIFVTEYLPSLDGLAVKLYLYALFAARNRRTFTEAEIARRLGAETDAVRAATAQLAAVGLVLMKERGFEIVDVKAAEVEKIYRLRTSAEPKPAADGSDGPAATADPRRLAREKLLGDIAKTFFQGLMSPSWYYEIETWFDRYRFEPEVIYALFQYCAGKGKLDGKGYIAKVAEGWASRGILTFQDLSVHFAQREKVIGISRRIGKKLHKGMTEYDEEKVVQWVEGMGYDFDVIELALRRTVKLQNPNLEYVDRILKEWFSNGLKTPEDVDRYEEERARKMSIERQTARSAAGTGFAPGGAGPVARPRNAGNFDQREYSDEFLGSLYDEVPAVDPQELAAARAAAESNRTAPQAAPQEARHADKPSSEVLSGQIDLFQLEREAT